MSTTTYVPAPREHYTDKHVQVYDPNIIAVAESPQLVEIFDLSNFVLTKDTDLNLGDADHSFSRCMFTLLLRVGWILVEMGSIPVTNVYYITIYNVLEIAVALGTYAIIGFIFSFGKSSQSGIIGYFSHISSTFSDLDNAVIGLSTCLIATAQLSSFLVGRMHLGGMLLIVFIYCSIFLPMLIHWIWNFRGWMAKGKLFGLRVSIKDHAGDLSIHISSGLAGLLGAIFLGRRILRMKDLHEFSIDGPSVTGTIIGYIFIIMGYVAFSLPTAYYESLRTPNNYTAIVTVNNLIALAAGVMVVSFLHLLVYRKIFTYWIGIRCIQGGLAGIVSVAAAVDIYSPFVAGAIAAVSAVIFFFSSILMHNTSLEDNCNVTAINLVCGVLGILAAPLFAQRENLGTSVNATIRGTHFLWQFICTLTGLACTALLFTILFGVLASCKILRNRHEVYDHKRALTLQRHLPRKKLCERLFMIDATTEHIEPGTAIRRKYGGVDTQPYYAEEPKTNKIQFSEKNKARVAQIPELENFTSVKIEEEPMEGYEPKTAYPLAYGSGDYYGPNPDFPTPNFPKPEFPKPEFPKPEFPKPEFLKPEFLKPESPKPKSPRPEFQKPIEIYTMTDGNSYFNDPKKPFASSVMSSDTWSSFAK